MPLDYPTQSLEEIKDYLQIATEHTTEDAVLFLWTTEKYLRQAEDIATELGYKLHNRMIYSKCGMGQAPAFTLRFSHEYLLYCYKGKFIPINKSCRGKYADVFEAKPRKHSQKPDIAYQIIEDLYPQLRKLEMYSRQARDGWDAFGNEVED